MSLREKKLFLFDMDGTLGIGENIFEGSRELLAHIRNTGGKYYFITNNTSKSTDAYINKMARWGIDAVTEDFITAGYVSIQYLKEHFGQEKIFVMATKLFVSELKKHGLNVTEEVEDDIKCVVVAYDNELTYHKLENICYILETRPDVAYLATNTDYCCPVSFGFVPDCHAMCDMIETATGRKPARYLGKPSREIVDVCIKESGYKPEETVVIGDRMYTDIACGLAADVDACLVLSGETKPEDVEKSEYTPTYIYPSVREMLSDMKTVSQTA